MYRFNIISRLSSRRAVLCILVASIAVFVTFVGDFNQFVNDNLVEFLNMNVTTTSNWYYIISTLGLFHSYTPIYNTTLGRIRGIISVSREGRPYYEFRSIPYAKSPVGDLRFQAPIPADPWKGLFTADKKAPACLQFDAMMRGEVHGQEEDCLILNIYTPNVINRKLLIPVIFYIHGGGFTGGESSMFNPKYFMDHKIIIVTCNYRLGSLGFLNTGDEFITGNMGFKDQNLALLWTKNHIQRFGGNPTKISIMGESAGAASAHYHVISLKSRGLFQKAIIQSGNLGSPWSFTKNPQHQALKFGKKLGCPVENTSVLVNCLKSMDPRDIVKPHEEIMSPIHSQDDFFPGSVEAVNRKDTFLSENPYEMLAKGDFAHVPIMFGVNNGEGGLKTARLESYSEVLEELDENWNFHIPVLLHYDPNRTDVSDKLRNYYFAKEEGGKVIKINPANDLVNLTKMLSAGIFFEGNHRMAKIHAKYAPTYMYYYTYISKSMPSTYALIKAARPKRWYSPWTVNYAQGLASYYSDKFIWKSKDPQKYGACHGEDLIQVFSMNPMLDIKTVSEDFTFSKNFVRSIVQFASDNGEDNLTFNQVLWPAINPDDEKLKYMQINETGGMIEEPFTNEIQFIESLGIRDPNETHNW